MSAKPAYLHVIATWQTGLRVAKGPMHSRKTWEGGHGPRADGLMQSPLTN